MSTKRRHAKEARRRLIRFGVIAGVLVIGAIIYEWKLAHVAELAVICEALLGAMEG